MQTLKKTVVLNASLILINSKWLLQDYITLLTVLVTQHTNNNCEATYLPTISMILSIDACFIFRVSFLLTK